MFPCLTLGIFQVIAFTCCFITVILMTAATSTADWILAEGWREGLFMQCIEEGAPTPLPFNMDPTVGCSKARSAGEKQTKVTEMPNAPSSSLLTTLKSYD